MRFEFWNELSLREYLQNSTLFIKLNIVVKKMHCNKQRTVLYYVRWRNTFLFQDTLLVHEMN
jgi:hypothetical protein